MTDVRVVCNLKKASYEFDLDMFSSSANPWLRENGRRSLQLLWDAVLLFPDFSKSLSSSGEQNDKTFATAQAALYLLDSQGFVVYWSSAAISLYGYPANEVISRHVSFLFNRADSSGDLITAACELTRVANQGYLGSEGWHFRSDCSRFWANTVTTALKDDFGRLQGYAAIVRDFSDVHEIDEQQKRMAARVKADITELAFIGIIYGQFRDIIGSNDEFLAHFGYSREELEAGTMSYDTLTAPGNEVADQRAHEEMLQSGSCTPYEKQFLKKDGTRVCVVYVIAVLSLLPFRWVAFMQDIRDRERFEPRQVAEVSEGEPEHNFGEMVGKSAALLRTTRQVEQVAPTSATVLILGETGTGKELVARAIHRLSSRRNMPCVTLNCAAIPSGLLESELFGYERGAFTGALSQKIGRFERAHRGTLFLDEVGDIPLDLQPKLLRAFQEKSLERLGSTKTIPIDVRLVAATNRNLPQMMRDKLFRSDLFYRLNVFPITTPSLRDRPEDIPILVHHFTQKYAAKMSRTIERIPSETMKALMAWNWPGNVRELESFIERSVILSRGPSLRAPLDEIRKDASLPSPATSTLAQMERDYIIRVLRETNGVVSLAAIRLGLKRTTLGAMIARHGISRQGL